MFGDRRVALLVATVLAGAVAACGGSSLTGPTDKAPPFPTVTGLAIGGLPAAPVIVGESVQLTASVTLPNGVRAQTSDATWQSSNKNVATVSASGVLTGTGFGEADVTATFQTVRQTEHVAVNPPLPQARLNITIDRHGSTAGITDVSDIVFDLSASTGHGLRYDLTFGDGWASTGTAIVRHVYSTGRCQKSYTAEATVTDVLGRTSTAKQTIVITSLPGCDNNLWYGPLWIRFRTQEGSRLVGNYAEPATLGFTFTGVVKPNHDIELLSSDGTRMTGSVILRSPPFGSPPDAWHLQLTFHGGPHDGLKDDFKFYSSY